MSKYIRVKDLKWHSPDESLVKPLTEFYVTESDIADLPTIDIVECEECRWRDVCSQVVSDIGCEVDTMLRWCSDGERIDK